MESNSPLGDATIAADLLDDDEADPEFVDDSTLPADRFLDRELSWLAFNQRVLELAEDDTVPILERANFLAIFASNLDEFFMVRVAGLKRRIATGLAVPTNVGPCAPRRARRHQRQGARAAGAPRPRVPARWSSRLSTRPACTSSRGATSSRPTATASTRSSRRRSSRCSCRWPSTLRIRSPTSRGCRSTSSIRVRNPKTQKIEFARLKMPQNLARLVKLPDDKSGRLRFIPLEDLISNHLDELFPGMEILEHHEFRVTRNEDVEIEEDDTESIIQALEKELLRRRFGPPIRLEISDDMDDVTLGLLMQELDITEQEVFRLPAPLDLGVLFELQRIDRPDLMFPKRIPTTSVSLLPSDPTEKPDIFASIDRGDILLHHPYESFATSVQAFLEQAAADPNVLAIKQTLYRTSGDSPIIEALIDAAEAGKAVLALVEIKARFDEQANISWARKLEKAGVHVVYGMVGLKTHCKLALVVRQDRNGKLKHYSHIGTGNYNPKTSRIYEDLGLLTADDQVGKDLTRLFNELSGYAIEKKFKRLLVAPLHLRKGLLKRIATEASNARAGKPSGIRLKVNSMVDETIIDALYKASQAGVPIDIWVRGICSLRPGVEGLSETIRVRSILGRYLEHSRIFSFANDEDPQVFIGSADMMHRNLDRRVETLVRLVRPEHLTELAGLFDAAMSEETSSWWLATDGEWIRHDRDAAGKPLADLQTDLMTRIGSRKRGASR